MIIYVYTTANKLLGPGVCGEKKKKKSYILQKAFSNLDAAVKRSKSQAS